MANTESNTGIAAWPNARARLMMWSSGAVSGSSLPARQARHRRVYGSDRLGVTRNPGWVPISRPTPPVSSP